MYNNEDIYSTLFVCFEKILCFFSGSPEHSRHTPLGSRPSCKIQLYPLLLVTRAQHRRFVQTRPFLLNFTCYGPLKKRRGCYNGRQWRRTCFFILSSTFVRCNSHQKISTICCVVVVVLSSSSLILLLLPHNNTGRFVTVAASGCTRLQRKPNLTQTEKQQTKQEIEYNEIRNRNPSTICCNSIRIPSRQG